jgi:hypothetical protein
VRYWLLTILALSTAVHGVAQTPAEAPALGTRSAEFTVAVPRGVPSFGEFSSLPFRNVLILKKADPEAGTLHRQLVSRELCVLGEPCTFEMHVELYLKDKADPPAMALRYVLVNERARAEGLGFSNTPSGVNRYWYFRGSSWTEYERGSQAFNLEEQFVAGTWDFVIQQQQQSPTP